MTTPPERFAAVKAIFSATIALDESARAAYLDAACRDDAELRQEVESLLASLDEAHSFLETPAAAALHIPSPADDVTGRTIGSYRVESLLGSGGMGDVYQAHDTRLDRPVALKLLSPRFAGDAERLRRFHAEGRAASSLNHPHILVIHDFGDVDGRPYMVTELVEGQTLRQRLQNGPLTLRDTAHIITQVGSALAAAHARGIVHRDIKPENVMLRPDGYVKVLDFGIAKLLAGDDTSADASGFGTHTGMVIGTPRYMSPEQAGGQRVDARSDLFALGTVAYELLTGRAPFGGETAVHVLHAIMFDAPKSLTGSGVMAAIDRVLQKAMAKDPAERYQSAPAMVADFRAAAGLTDQEEPAIPAPVAPTARFAAAWWLIAAALVIMTIGVASWNLRTPAPPPLTERDSILLADIENMTGDPALDDTMKTALALALEQSPYLQLVPDAHVRETVVLTGRARDTAVTNAIAREVCQRDGIAAVLTGVIAPTGSRYAFTLDATACQSGDLLAREHAEVAGREQVLAGLGQAAARIRSKLGESLASVQRFDAPLERATTTSLEALKAYSTGVALRQTSGASREQVSIPHFRRAIELDPDFALAYTQLGTVYFNGNRSLVLARQNLQAAFDRRDRTTERERLSIVAAYHTIVTGDLEKAIEVTEVLRKTYPNDHLPARQLGHLYSMSGMRERAVEAGEAAARRRPTDVTAGGNLAQWYIGVNRFDDARAMLEDGIARKLWPRGGVLLYELAFIRNDATAMQREVEAARGLAQESVIRASQHEVLAFGGQIQRSRELARTEGLSAPSALTMAAAREALVGNLREAAMLVDRAQRGDPSPEAQINASVVVAQAGAIASANALIDTVVSQFPTATEVRSIRVPIARAALALRQGHASEAVKHLDAVTPYERAVKVGVPIGMMAPYLRGYAHLEQRSSAAAAAEFRKLIANRGLLRVSVLFPLAHVGLARALVQAGDAAEAAKAYQEFFFLWKDADADIPILIAARREFAALRLPPPQVSTTSDIAAGKHRLAVLPFENLTRNAADDWLSAGLADSLTFGLQNLSALILTTRERTGAVYLQHRVHAAAPLDPNVLKTLVEELGVTSYVHGTYQRVGDEIRVVARLVSIDTGQVTAQESVTDRFVNVLKLEDELANRFAAKLDASGRAARPSAGTTSVDAYRAYSEAQVLYDNVQDREGTRQHLREAVRLDPRYAQAWALLSKAHSRSSLLPGRAHATDDEEGRDALRMAARAVEIDPLLYDGHVALALAHRRGERIGPWRAEAEKAIALNPRVAEAYAVLAGSYSASPSWGCGRDRDAATAEQYFGISIRLEPRSAQTYGAFADHLLWKGDYEQALTVANQGLRVLPDNDFIKGRRVYAFLNMGRIDDVRATLQGMTAGRMASTGDHLFVEFWLETLRGGPPGPAAERFRNAVDLKDPVIRIRHAWVLTSGNRASAALRHLDEALQLNPTCRDFIASAAAFAPLRHTTEFAALLAKAR